MTSEFVTPSQTIVREMFVNDEGIFAIPEPFVATVKPEGVVAVKCTSFPVSVNTHVIFKKDPPMSLKRFINYIISHVYGKPHMVLG